MNIHIWCGIIIVFLAIFVHSKGPPTPGNSNVKFKLYNLEMCSTSSMEENKNFDILEFVLDNADANGFKKLSLKWNLKTPFNEKWQYDLTVDQFDGADWRKNIYDRQEPVCKDIQEFFPDTWEKIRTKTQPNFEKCSGKPGIYQFKNLEILRNEYTFPGVVFGRVRIHVNVYDQDENHILCAILEGGIQ